MLNALLVGAELLNLLDEIKHFDIYRQSLKNKVNLLMPELERHVNHIQCVLGTDDKVMFDLMDKKDLITQMATIRPEYKLGMGELLKQFHDNPRLVLHRNGITFK